MSFLTQDLTGYWFEEEGRSEQWDRNCLDDLKYGMELIYQLKIELDGLHPAARGTLINMVIN